MSDTPEHIKKLQLDIWLSKSPMERLLQFLQDNEAIYDFWKQNQSLKNGFTSKMFDNERDFPG